VNIRRGFLDRVAPIPNDGRVLENGDAQTFPSKFPTESKAHNNY